MGNSLHVPLLGHSGSPRFPCHLQLPSAAIDLSIDVMKTDDEEFLEVWSASYTIDESTCKLTLKKHVDKGGNIKALHFSVSDRVHLRCGLIYYRIERSAIGTLPNLSCKTFLFESAVSQKNNKVINAWGGFTNTTSYLYGWTGNQGGLVVGELKRNTMDDPFVNMTVAHYFALNRSTETSIGLSVVAKVRAYNNGNFDVTVEGPEQHPASALLYMFEEVNRTGIWKSTMCAHCAQTRKRLSRILWQQSDTEDTDSDPLPPPRGSRQNAPQIANSGRFRGHVPTVVTSDAKTFLVLTKGKILIWYMYLYLCHEHLEICMNVTEQHV